MKTFFFILSIAFLATSCQKQTATLLTTSVNSYVIDGKANEWTENFLTDKAFPDWTYQIAYNKEYLYICTRTISKQMQMLTIQQGAGVWIDTTNKKQNKMGVSFPLALADAQVQQLARLGADERLLEKKYAELCTEFDMIGFAPEPLRANNTASKHCKSALAYDELGELICEYQIPWKFIYQNRTLKNNEIVHIHLKINDLKIDEEEQINQNPNSVANNPNGQMGGNGNPMGNQNPNANNTNPFNPQAGRQMALSQNRRPQMPSIWLKIQLNN